jgi:hypothetical protein
MMGQRRISVLEWLILLGLTACAIAASEVLGLKPQWEDGLIYTVIVFVAVLLALRPAWGRRSFWTSLALIFVGHTIALFAVLQALPPRRFGIPKLLLIPVGAVEIVFVLGILWRMKALRTSEPHS